ncbi:MAG: PP2C family protein-serine/threonine phosphatase, partial [Bradymonadaceae bacterium]
MPLKAWARTDTGHVRTNNEDSYLVDITHGVFVVADGVGGLEGGEVASGAVVDQIGRLSNALHQTVLAQASLNDMEHRQTIVNHLVECLHITNTYIYEQGLDPRYQKGIATTAELLLVSNEAAYVAHVGDSRIYLLRNGEIFRITQDHTLAEQLKEGYPGRRGLTELIKRHTHVLTRSLGTRPHVEIDTLYVDLFAGDRFLMCSDGLTDYLSGAEILKRADGEDPQAFVDGLVDEAKARGGKDNITVVLVEIPPEDMLVDRTPTRPDVMHGARFLKDIELFEDLPLPQLLKLMRIATSRTYKLGDYIVQQ